MHAICVFFALLSIWDYPARHPQHLQLKSQMVQAVRAGETQKMYEACLKGAELLPDDPTWAYNLACALSYRQDPNAALDQLEKAIDLGFRDADAIANDNDLRRLAKNPRFRELVGYAKETKDRPILLGPLASVPATGVTGKSVVLGEQNLAWDFDLGCFEARLVLAPGKGDGNDGDLYMNRDAAHSMLAVTNWPGLTEVKLDLAGRQRGMDLDFPNLIFPYPVFGNCSRAYLHPVYWRSIPRALMTTDAARLQAMSRFYLSNQTWVFPAVNDFNPGGTNRDCFASVTPYWIATQGASWSDQYYLRAALEASRSFKPAVKRLLVLRGLLAPTIQSVLRKSLKGVMTDEDYLGPKAHPTAFPPNGLDLAKVSRLASELKLDEIPPVAIVRVAMEKTDNPSAWPECTYATACASAFVLRAPAEKRAFLLQADGGKDYAFRVVHGDTSAVRLTHKDGRSVLVELERAALTNRLDIAVFAKNGTSGWGAPSFVSFFVQNPDAAYSDPALNPQLQVK